MFITRGLLFDHQEELRWTLGTRIGLLVQFISFITF